MMLTAELARENARWIEKAGADAIMVRSHWLGYHVPGYLTDLLFYPDPPIPLEKFPKEYYAKEKGVGANTLLAAAIKKEVSIPVTVVGRLDADFGERLLEAGACDFIGMTRRLHADPDYVNKIRAGRHGRHRSLHGLRQLPGHQGLPHQRSSGHSLHRYRQGAGEEEGARHRRRPRRHGSGSGVGAARPRRDPLREGSQAGRSAAHRRHRQGSPSRGRAADRRLPRRPGQEAGREEWSPARRPTSPPWRRSKPDVVFLATGASATIPPIKGIDRPNVMSGAALHKQLKMATRFVPSYTMRRLTKYYLPLGKNVVVIGGVSPGLRVGRVPGQARPQRDHRGAGGHAGRRAWWTPCSSAS